MIPTQAEFDSGDELSKDHFDRLCPEDFKIGPFMDSQGPCGGNYKDVLYMPDKRAWGWLKDGRMVWAWVRGVKVRKQMSTTPAASEWAMGEARKTAALVWKNLRDRRGFASHHIPIDASIEREIIECWAGIIALALDAKVKAEMSDVPNDDAAIRAENKRLRDVVIAAKLMTESLTRCPKSVSPGGQTVEATLGNTRYHNVPHSMMCDFLELYCQYELDYSEAISERGSSTPERSGE